MSSPPRFKRRVLTSSIPRVARESIAPAGPSSAVPCFPGLRLDAERQASKRGRHISLTKQGEATEGKGREGRERESIEAMKNNVIIAE